MIGNAKAGDVIGEIGALCYRPQPYTVRSSKLSQLLRVDRNTFLNIVQGNPVDGQIVIDNLYQVYFNTYMFQNSPLFSRRFLLYSSSQFSGILLTLIQCLSSSSSSFTSFCKIQKSHHCWDSQKKSQYLQRLGQACH
mgnify:CR=1 FL=1